MLCSNCGENEANIKYTEIINGNKKEMALCEKCSKELGIGDLDFNIPINFSSFLGDFFEDTEKLLPTYMESKQEKCDVCGMTFDDFVNTSKFGCSNCYDAFPNKIETMLKNLHGSSTHTGRIGKVGDGIHYIPQNVGGESLVLPQKEEENKENVEQYEIKKLKDDLKKAIKDERYEDAASLRDQINQMENKGDY